MKLDLKTPGQTINKAYAKQTVRRDELDKFRENLSFFLNACVQMREKNT